MKLYLSISSPFSRIALIAMLRNQSFKNAQLEVVDAWQNPESLMADNPFSQVPTLITENGISINHTMAICAYLEQNFLANPHQAHVSGYALVLIETFVRYFLLSHKNGQLKGDEMLIQRSLQKIITALPKAPQLNSESEDLSQYMLAVALIMLETRQPALYQGLSAANKAALSVFKNKPLIQLTDPVNIAKKPTTIKMLRENFDDQRKD